ncbi:hypothetical protein QR680_013171 [Steinernema hermaphroditum]|uniref:G-protein coupled receptors family 1 profile domain-containing protein n=1 Tax=Steinernema hermaphroditum TaxID=289476 RepID=A0AA39M219_9BILA|nr:hypothetical protein QR680_013171 [Steinernema hermaphroditum]
MRLGRPDIGGGVLQEVSICVSEFRQRGIEFSISAAAVMSPLCPSVNRIGVAYLSAKTPPAAADSHASLQDHDAGYSGPVRLCATLMDSNDSSTLLLLWPEASLVSLGVQQVVNGSQEAHVSADFVQTLVVGVVLLLLILFTVVGNLFVILAILLERDLRSRPQYYLIFSLAVADLLVGLIVTPLYAWSTVLQAWRLGVALCDFWISVDVLVCTSSILHLVAIALDRYWSVTDVSYVQNRTPRRIFIMLALIWILSLLISLAPIFGWKDSEFVTRVTDEEVCLISQKISYQVFSTATAFYIPLIAIIGIYYKIMRAAKRRFKRERDRRTVINRSMREPPKYAAVGVHAPPPPPPKVLLAHDSAANGASSVEFKTTKHSESSHDSTGSEDERTPIKLNGSALVETKLDVPSATRTSICASMKRASMVTQWKLLGRPPRKKRSSKENAETRRERKAWRTLAIITGTFVACWTPFFLVSLYRPICGCKIPVVLESVTAWLGYLNSAINPVIYSVFSMDMRLAFQKILKRMCFIQKF